MLHDTFRWLFTPPQEPITFFRVVGWWELRRIPYNLIIAVAGAISLTISFISIVSTGTLGPGEDAVEPIALLFAPIAINVCYTAGWLVEAPLRLLLPYLSPGTSPSLFKLGLGFSLIVVTTPAVYWGSHRLLQLFSMFH